MAISLSDRLIHFERQVQYFDAVADEISSAPYSEDKITQSTTEYEATNYDLMRCFETEVQNVAGTLVEPFQTAMISQFQTLLNNWEDSGKKLFRSYRISENDYKLNDLFANYEFFCKPKSELGLSHLDELKKKNCQIVKSPTLTPTQMKKTIELHNAIQKHQQFAISKMLRELHALIEKAIHCPKEEQDQFIQRIEKICNEDMHSCEMARKIHSNLFDSIEWEEEGSESEEISPSLLQKCDAMITSHPLYKNKDVFEIINAIDSSSEDENKDLGSDNDEISKLEMYDLEIEDPKAWKEIFHNRENDPLSLDDECEASVIQVPIATKTEDQSSDLSEQNDEKEINASNDDETRWVAYGLGSIEVYTHAVRETEKSNSSVLEHSECVAEEKTTNLPDFENEENVTEAAFDNEEVSMEPFVPDLDLSTLKTIILNILSMESRGNLSDAMRTALINQARNRLPEKMRWDLDGIFFELSNDPNKGGEGWGGKHAAEDPSLLIEAIETGIKRQSLSD